jgi:molecular chaperone DnaK (HSP70)
MEYIIGIDLGTTNSCVGVMKNDKVEIIPNCMGNRITPSMVCFKEKEILVGNAAKNQRIKYYSTTIFEIKR